MEKYIDHKGKKFTVKHFKALHLISKSIAMNDNFEPLPWTKSCKKGIPSILRSLLPFLQGDSAMKRAGLTVTRSYELITLDPDFDTSAITDPSPKPISPEFKETFTG